METQRKLELKEIRQQKHRERKDAMNVPIAPFPEREMCLYEKIREDNIKERMNAMEKCNFFDDLMDMKNNLGFYKEKTGNQSAKDSDGKGKQKHKVTRSNTNQIKLSKKKKDDDKTIDLDG